MVFCGVLIVLHGAAVERQQQGVRLAVDDFFPHRLGDECVAPRLVRVEVGAEEGARRCRESGDEQKGEGGKFLWRLTWWWHVFESLPLVV
jgi:hypothetical protein